MKRFTISIFTILFSCISVLNAENFAAFKVAAENMTFEENVQNETVYFDSTDYYSSMVTMNSDTNILFNEESYKYYDSLDSNNKAAYDAMKIWLEPTEEYFNVKLPEPVTVKNKSKNMDIWTDEELNELWSLVIPCIREGKTALTFDYPEIFWLDESSIKLGIYKTSSSYSRSEKTYKIVIETIVVGASVKEEYGDVETAKEYQQLYENAVSSYDVKGDDYYTKLKNIHDDISTTVTYDMSAPYHDTGLGFFIEPYGIVCEGYSKALKILCDRENIPCVVVVGNVNSENSTAHMWNYVKMDDGKWYAVDCTWDDLDREDLPIKYQYFLKGSESFNIDHIADNSLIAIGFNYPELSESDYVYGAEEISESNIDIILGDFNENGVIEVSDIVILKEMLIGVIDITDNQLKHDTNNDGKINVWDFIILKRMLNN